MVCTVCGSKIVAGCPVRFAKGKMSPAPVTPGFVKPPLPSGCPRTSQVKPSRQDTIGYSLQPCVSRLGAEDNIRSNGKSQPPLNVIRWRTSKSDDARNKVGL